MAASTRMFVGSGFRRALHDAAPNLTKRFFSCQARPSNVAHRPSIHSFCNRRAFLKDFKDARQQIQQPYTLSRRSFKTTARLTEAIKSVEDTIVQSSRFPDTSSNAVAYWLLASAASVFGIVVFGGLTRLTESGYVSTKLDSQEDQLTRSAVCQ